jgi:hypothetical protein
VEEKIRAGVRIAEEKLDQRFRASGKKEIYRIRLML